MLNGTLNDYVKNNLKPDDYERSMIKGYYDPLKEIFGNENVFQSGSYSRATSISPVNDLDIIWVMPRDISEEILKMNDLEKVDVSNILVEIAKKLELEFKKRSISYSKIIPQSHSVGIYFGTEEEFSIDIVPAIELDEVDKYDEPLYFVPEIINQSKRKKNALYKSNSIQWIKSDPRGYKQYISSINDLNNNFRPTIRIIKKWKRNLVKRYKDFPLKSFHLELILADITQQLDYSLEVKELLSSFYSNLTKYIQHSCFEDLANSNQYVDEYINSISESNRNQISMLCKSALYFVNQFNNNDEQLIKHLLRMISPEEFIEYYGYMRAINPNLKFEIDGHLGKIGSGILLSELSNKISKGQSIYYYLKLHGGQIMWYDQMWKVRNTGIEATEADCLRGEINPKKTKNTPETTQYSGYHYVTCYLINGNQIIAEASLVLEILR